MTEPLEEQLAAVAGQVERLARAHAMHAQATDLKIETLAQTQVSQAASIGALRAALPMPGDAVPEVIPDWMTLADMGLAEKLLADLTKWVDATWRGYEPGTRPCWPWHPLVVADLLACRVVHDWSLSKVAPPTAYADWQLRIRPGTHAQVTRATASCNPDHQEAGRRFAVDPARSKDYARWWAGRGRRDGAPTPGLTPIEETR